ncbi:hypothetical protein CCR75_002584 [Bremia lactucae]|uniref:Uncharacterized protein n=1 Tax=Bremia lactucae TaxID=4779 RepID=A0A976IL85_BRELC|nr:hypothetical protein CCR75_002584 [Bremia lactucae]
MTAESLVSSWLLTLRASSVGMTRPIRWFRRPIGKNAFLALVYRLQNVNRIPHINRDATLPQGEEREKVSPFTLFELSTQHGQVSPHVRHGSQASRDNRCNLYFEPIGVYFSALTRFVLSF